MNEVTTNLLLIYLSMCIVLYWHFIAFHHIAAPFRFRFNPRNEARTSRVSPPVLFSVRRVRHPRGYRGDPGGWSWCVAETGGMVMFLFLPQTCALFFGLVFFVGSKNIKYGAWQMIRSCGCSRWRRNSGRDLLRCPILLSCDQTWSSI